MRIAGVAGGGYAPRPMRRWVSVSACAVGFGLLCMVGPARAEDPPVRQIEYRADRLTVRVTQVSLTEVLQETARQAGAEVVGGVKEERTISADFTRLPLDQGLARLLGKQNFMLVYSRVGLRAIELLGGPQEPLKIATATVAAPPPTASGMPGVFQMFQTRPPLPVSGRLGAALGADKATYPQLLDSAMHNEDVAVRSEAMRVWLQGLEDDPELRGAFVSAVNGIDDQQLATSLRGMAGTNAEELLQQVTSIARGGDIRMKASQVFLQLRKIRPGA